MTQYYPPYRNSSNNIKVELDLANYATHLTNITHVDVSSFASKTNLAALKTEVDKIDRDKLKTTPADLAKLSNVVENEVVKKTDYNTKVTSIEAQIAGLTKNTVDNLADITKLKAIDTNSFVTRTKFSADTNSLDDKIDGVEKKVTDISGLATKTSLNYYLKTSTFNSKVTEVERKIKDADIIAKSAVTEANTIRSNLTAYAKKDIATTKKDYVTKFVLSLHYNRNDSYLFINGKQELKFKAKSNPVLIEKRLCIGNLSAQWSTSESEKTGLYGNIYDVMVNYKGIKSVKYIYDMHRYLMIKHNINIQMKIISLLISLFNIIKTKALESVSVVNQKCMPRLKYLM